MEKSLLVLGIDDDKGFQFGLSHVLRECKHTYVGAQNPQQFKPILDFYVDRAHLVLLDKNLVAQKGDDLILPWRALYGARLPPIAVCSGEDVTVLERMVQKYRLAGYVRKPIDPEQIGRQLCTFARSL